MKKIIEHILFLPYKLFLFIKIKLTMPNIGWWPIQINQFEKNYVLEFSLYIPYKTAPSACIFKHVSSSISHKNYGTP